MIGWLVLLACQTPTPSEAPGATASAALRPETIRLELHNQDDVREWERQGGAVMRWTFAGDAVYTLATRDENGASRGVRLDELDGKDSQQIRDAAMRELERELGKPTLQPTEDAGIFRLLIEQGPSPADALLVHRAWHDTMTELGGELYAIVPNRGEVQVGGPGTACALSRRIGPAVIRGQESVSHIVYRWAPRGWEAVKDPCAGPATAAEVERGRAYFPGWPEDRAVAVARYLEAMREPPMAELAVGGLTVVRVTRIPAQDKPVSSRITLPPSGEATLASRRLGGLGGYGPGALEDAVDRALTPTELSDTQAALAALDLAGLKPPTAPLDAQGARWILEVGGPAGSYAVERTRPGAEGPDAAFRQLGRVLLQVAGAPLTDE